MNYLSWNNLVVGYPRQKPLVYPFCGHISAPGIYAILGQNGCGKSTLLKTWLGLVPARSGSVVRDASPVTTKNDILQGIAYVPQFHSVNSYFHITVEDFIKQGLGPSKTGKQTANKKQTEEQLFSLLRQWQLEHCGLRSFHQLSGGQKTRAMIARALISKPKILFLDEPLASLDACCQKQLMETLHDLWQAKGLCIFMVDHHFERFFDLIKQKFVFVRDHDNDTSSVVIE